jgi:hypothetical protein
VCGWLVNNIRRSCLHYVKWVGRVEAFAHSFTTLVVLCQLGRRQQVTRIFFFLVRVFFCFAAVGRKQKLLCRNVITAAVKRILSRSGYVSNALWPNTFFFVFFLFSFLPFDLFACSLENLKKGMKNQIRKSKSKEMTNCDSNPVPICLPARWIVSTFFGEVRCWNS